VSWFRHATDSTGAIDYTSGAHTCQLLLRSIVVSWDAAPTTAASLTVTLDSELGTAYDTEIYVVDPSVNGLTAVLLTDVNLLIFKGDAITVTYDNPDARTVGVQILLSD